MAMWEGLLAGETASRAESFELNGGVGAGGILAGAKPRFVISPHVALTWSSESGFLAGLHETPNILPALNTHGPGIYNQLSGVVGYAWKDINVGLGPAFSVYSMSACNTTICSHVTGFSVGGHAQLDLYFVGPLGVSVSANVDWIGGSSAVLPGGVGATVFAGPILRWRVK